MLCLSCHRPFPGGLCAVCSRSLRPSPDRILPGGLRVVSAFEHEGVARRLVHLIKYRGVPLAADLMARELSTGLPELPLVPVPRVLTRRMRYGIDPAVELAKGIARHTGLPVLSALRAPLHSSRRAGHNDNSDVARYTSRVPARRQVILVDDVVTTGATLLAAASAIGYERVELAVCATSTPGMSSLHIA